MSEKTFPSPYSVSTPEGCDGWEEMYPRFYLFDKELERHESNKFWFLDGVHNPNPVPPFDILWLEAWLIGLNQMTTRVLMVPRAKGIDHRILNGYFYVSPTTADWADDVVEKRTAEFKKRAGYYYENWDRLLSRWNRNMTRIIDDVRGMKVELPDYVDLSLDYLSNESLSPAHLLHVGFRHLIDLAFEAEAQRHFELANLAYAALLTFFDFMKQKFPGIKESTIVKLVEGIDTLLLRPDEEARKLAKLAYRLGLAPVFTKSKDWKELQTKLEESETGKSWIEQYKRSEYPWFYVHSGATPNREYFYFKSWVEDPTFLFTGLKSYIGRLEKGENIDRNLSALIEERERLKHEYRNLLDKKEVETYDKLQKLAESTYQYAEDHVFIVSNWFRTVFYLKVKEFASILVAHGFLNEVDDIFYLHYQEVETLLRALEAEWATMNPSIMAVSIKPVIARRKQILARFRDYRPPPALGVPPSEVTDPYMIMLWGLTGDKIRDWLKTSKQTDQALEGFPACAGSVEGVARLVLDTSQLSDIKEGEILVCPITSPNWGPIFPKVKAIVTDMGGMMSHAAIIAREYSIPAVVGTGYATRTIRTSDKIRVDGNEGKVYRIT